MNWWEVIGWTGSVLVVLSLWIPSVRRFRILNLTGSLIATIYNAYFGIWPYAAMNSVIVGIDAYWLIRLSRGDSTPPRGYAVVQARASDPLVQHFISRNSTDIKANYPNFSLDAISNAQIQLILHEDELVGIFAMTTANSQATILADYVTPRFRDLGPGRYVYAQTEFFSQLGIDQLRIEAEATTDPDYFAKQGFSSAGAVLTRNVG
ncbi:hypothetical protein JTE88_02295 [Arcanobacterium phocisimile]|uniref:Inner membrane protein n=1 Tax=Arcanobacterium phocisimile TaxID=1302235 RepID=A0ABX7IHJ6_9ACTO|nr:hypothetical protein [Arcanobacterium phocisimile]QRV02599.1 hypothetical protein JTE88_02295 [Arcanobacterium phocisimile]